MRHCSTGSQVKGFTLIELLTVIAIIAVLMGLLFPAIGAVQDGARKAQAKNDMSAIVSALNMYYTEYGRYPTAAANATTDSQAAQALNVLRPPATGDAPPENPRRINFLEGPAVKDEQAPKAGFNQAGAWFDPWGKSYKFTVDQDYNNQLDEKDGFPSYKGSKAGPTELRAGVAAWSWGKNTKEDTNTDDKNFDDVLSWQ